MHNVNELLDKIKCLEEKVESWKDTAEKYRDHVVEMMEDQKKLKARLEQCEKERSEAGWGVKVRW